MPTEIDWEIRIDAEDMYISGGLTYEQVAEKTGVSLATLKRWGSDGGWTDRKKELREAQRDIKQKTVMLRLGLIKTAMDGHDPMQVFAAAKFEGLALKKEALRDAITGPGSINPPMVSLETPGEAVSLLQGAIERKIGTLVSGDSQLDVKVLKDLKACMDLLDQMKQKDASQTPDEKRTLDADEIRNIREQLKL
jgi:DNA-binding transcriptional regulator YiaG